MAVSGPPSFLPAEQPPPEPLGPLRLQLLAQPARLLLDPRVLLLEFGVLPRQFLDPALGLQPLGALAFDVV